MTQRAVVVLLLVACSQLPLAADEEPRLQAGRAHRGMAFLTSSVGKETSVEEIETFVRACRMDFVVLDFAWITHHWPRTDLAAIAKLAHDLEAAGVVVAAMYRPRALRPEEAPVHLARDENGEVAAHHNELCFAHEDSVQWGAAWGTRILEACPAIDHVLLYNVRAPCRCEDCRDGQGMAHATRFLATCRDVWAKARPGVRVGHVGVGLEHAGQVDFLCPFLSVQRSGEDEGVDTDALVRAARALRERVPDKPLVPLAKISWASATRNTTEDVVNTVRSAERSELGFCLWYYGWVLHSEEGRYDPRAVVEALGGDWATLQRFYARPATTEEEAETPATGRADGRHWVYFDSREEATGPRLVLESETGTVTELRAEADTVLISYLADGAWGRLPRLSISLGDTNRVLLRFPLEGVDDVGRAELRLHVHPSQIPPPAPFEMALHSVEEAWTEADTTWANPPAFAEEPFGLVTVPVEESEVGVDVTALVRAWASGQAPNHGLLLKVAHPVPAGRAPLPRRPSPPSSRAPTAPWTQPPIRTGTPFSDTIQWAATIEEALERAKQEEKLVLATVVPIQDRRWTSGFEDARQAWAGTTAHPWGDERVQAIDAGLVKERAMMATLFTDPAIVHGVTAHFVPVRVRLHTYHFDEGAPVRTPDPLAALGTSARDVGGPALVFSTPGGDLVHVCRRMGVFSVPFARSMLGAVLRKARVQGIRPYAPPRHAKLERAWALVREGELESAARALEGARFPTSSPHVWEARYLEGWLATRRGDEERARVLFAEVAEGDPEGPWGSRAALQLADRGLQLDEWETVLAFPHESLAERTEVGTGGASVEEVAERAVDVLLVQQRPDGGWHDPFLDVHPMAGPGSAYDKAVPRTGLVADALMQMRPRLPRRRKEIDRAIERGIRFVGRFADDPQPHVWKLTYALHLQVAILRSDLRLDETAARRRASRLIEALGGIQHQGGWSYMRPPRIHSFNTAPVQLLLAEARDLGIDVPDSMLDDAAAFLEGLRRPEDPREFSYASNVHHRAVRSSSCRTALCELALLAHGGGTDVEGLRAGVELFFEHEASTRDTTKVFESYFALTSLHDAYHYYFGHYYTARALERLPPAEAKKHARRQMEIVLAQRELDGSFVDAQMQGKSYSTAMALLTLLEDLRQLAR